MISALLFLIQSALAVAPPCAIYLASVEGDQQNLEAVIGDNIVGRLRYTPESSDALYVDGIFVHPRLRGQGISKQLFSDMLAREPGANEVGAMLVMDNYIAMGGPWFREPLAFEECINRVKRTPFYKAASFYGFEHVTRCMHRMGMGAVHIKLRRVL